MSTLAHTAPARRETAARPAFGRFWTAGQEAISGVFYRIGNAVYRSRSKQAQREIAEHLAGRRLTDAVEREIAARLMSGGWDTRR